MRKTLLMPVLALALLAAPLAAGEAGFTKPDKAPSKLSDLHKFLIWHLQDALGAPVKARPTILGLSTQILKTGRFAKIELEAQPFRYQELNFDKFEMVVEHFWIKPEALQRWDLEIDKVGDSLSRLVFTLPSLEKKLDPSGDIKIKPDINAQRLELQGRGRFLFIPMAYRSQVSLRFDGKKLYLKPEALHWGPIPVPLCLAWLGGRTVPEAPVLDLSNVWMPLNIQEVHLSWDTITLSTNW